MSNKILVKVGSLDLTPYLMDYKTDYNVLVADTGRNAAGNLRLQVINRKAKLNIRFRPLNEDEMKTILLAIKPFTGLSVQFWDVEQKAQRTITCYTNTASPDMYWNKGENALYKDMSLALIEL